MVFQVYAGDLGQNPKQRTANVQSAQQAAGCGGRGDGRNTLCYGWLERQTRNGKMDKMW